MTIHLLVVGKHEPSSSAYNAGIREAWEVAQETDTFKKEYCSSPNELVEIVRGVALRTNQRIDVLDLYDHGGYGIQKMGDDVLFAYDGRGLDIARNLRPFLTPDARVRLLGCETALQPGGRELLLTLRAALGASIVIYGTIERIEADTKEELDFDRNGFKQAKEEGFLFSSTEAQDRPAPDHEARSEEISTWHKSLNSLRSHASDPSREVDIAVRPHIAPVGMIEWSVPTGTEHEAQASHAG